MKPWKGKRGRIAAGASVSLHAAVYLALAAGGFFTLFQQYTRQAGVTEVMVYNAEDLAGAGGRDAAGTDEDLGGAADPEGRAEASGAMAAGEVASTNPDEMGTAADGMTYGTISQARREGGASTGSGTVSRPPALAGKPQSASQSGRDSGGTVRAAGPGKNEAAAPAGTLQVPDAVADILDALRKKIPVKLSEAKIVPPTPTIPPSQSNTTVITAENMEAHQDTTVQQALQRVTGVTVNEMVPGISSYVKLNGDDRVLILVDGQSLANAQGSGYGRGSVDLASLPGIGAIDHIEVTKGSGSVRYGSGAVGGVINIVTKKGDRRESSLDAYTGSWGMHGYTLTDSGRAGATSWLVSGSLEQREYYAFPHGANTDHSRGDIAKKSLSLRLDQDLTDQTSLTVKAYHQDYHGHGSTYKADPAGWYLTANKPIDRLVNDYSVTYHFKKQTAQPGFLRYFNDYQRTYWSNHYFTRTQGLEWQDNWQLGSHQHVTAGAEWTEDMGTNYEAHYIDKKRHNQAFYAEDALTFGKFTVTPGLRWDRNSTFGSHQTPRLAMNYKANDAFNVYASWGRVFSPPRLNDQFYITSTSHGNENLQPEEGYTQTLGFQYQAGPKTSLEGSIFHSNLENVIRWNRTSSYSEAENLNEEDKRGFELTWKQKVNDKWDYEGGYSYIRTKVDKGAGLTFDTTYNQPNGYHAGIHYHSGKWQAGADMTAGTGRNDTYYRNNSYVVWNVSASYSPDAATTMYVKVNNLNDEAYDLYHNYPAAGRNWQVGVKKKF
ncbi:vitamin B12 transporter [Megasphaera elsdenii]|uniref:TonB-dependent receptor plug domain-containing protein n=2 Tax=Megasphaera TaxID=906 RepID=UPI0008DF7965|nr:TonB-dependent receptor [Megasphaera elsdenii]MCQ4113795.1 TonB-dependent receptor [Megasphaera sp. SC8-1]MDY5382747.1 TonB-dependent receptor [Megasphaera elsdenii]SFH83612.1 vitamin B12 transporter [Megasphaera elsdenii]